MRRILQGGMGVVYLVYDHEGHEVLAAKTLRTELLHRSPNLAELFLKEALIWLHLDVHENVAEARYAETIGEQPYLFLQYASGGDLSQRIGSDWLLANPPRIALLGVQFCDGMLHVLSRGVQAHRDIKPQNCLLSDRNVLQVTDFGLIKLRDTLGATNLSGAELPQAESAGGTLTHMAPEQFADPGGGDVRVDVYAFGVMLYQMLRGRLPFAGRSYGDWARCHQTLPAAPMPDAHQGLASIALRCLEKNPDRRYGGFEALREELAGIHEELTGERPPYPAKGAELKAAKILDKAAGLGNLGYWDAEISLCDELLVTHGQAAAVWICKGTAMLNTGRIADADNCYERAIELDPSYATAWANRAASLRRLGHLGEAARCATRATDIDPHYATAWVNLGAVLTQQGKPAEALQVYDEALRCDPLDLIALSMRVMLLLQGNRPLEALSGCKTALERAPQDAQLWLLAAQCHDVLGRQASGEQRLQEREEAHRCRAEASRLAPKISLLALDIARRKAKAGQWEDALRAVNTFLTNDETSGPAWALQGRALLHLGRAKDAVVAYQRAIDREPWSAPHQVDLGLAHGHAGQHAHALRAFDAALRIAPDDEGAWKAKRTAIGRLAEDEDFTRRAKRLEQQVQDPLDCYTWGALAGDRGDWDQAIRLLAHAVDQAPAMREAWLLLGLAHAETGALAHALPCFEQARDLGHSGAAEYIMRCRRAGC